MPAPVSPTPGVPGGEASVRGLVRLGTVDGVTVAVSGSAAIVVALLAAGFAPRAVEVEPDLGAWAYVIGAAVAVLVYVAALVHEAAHAWVARRYGHRVESITLSVLGGRTTVDGEAQTPREEFLTAVVGPVASVVLGGAALGIHAFTGDGVLALALEVLVLANGVLGLLDLLPAPPLDGGRLVKAVGWRLGGSRRRGGVAAAWSGRVVAVAVVVVALLLHATLLYLVLALVVAAALLGSAQLDLAATGVRARLETVSVRDLARTVVSVPEDLPLAEALRRAEDVGAGGIVTLDGREEAVGLVSATALSHVPADRRPWVTASSVARALGEGTSLRDDIAGGDLLRVVNRTPASEFLLLRPDGRVRGVLLLRDLDRVLRDR